MNNNIIHKLFLLSCLVLLSLGAQAQKVEVSGVVADAKGEPIIGATIFEAGTKNGTITEIGRASCRERV